MVEASTTERTPIEAEANRSCAERVEPAWQSRRDNLKAMLDPGPEDLSIERDGNEYVMVVAERTVTNDNGADLPLDDDELGEITYTNTGDGNPERALADCTEEQRQSIIESVFEYHEGGIKTTAAQAFNEYGLGFDYVAPGTFDDQPTGFWRYQISWGGPSQEIRFYGSPRDTFPARIEFWHLDWFDGAFVDVTRDDVARAVWTEFKDIGMVEHAYEEAME